MVDFTPSDARRISAVAVYAGPVRGLTVKVTCGVNDWIVSGRGALPRPLGERPVVECGPVTRMRGVSVEMNVEKRGEGEILGLGEWVPKP